MRLWRALATATVIVLAGCGGQGDQAPPSLTTADRAQSNGSPTAGPSTNVPSDSSAPSPLDEAPWGDACKPAGQSLDAVLLVYKGHDNGSGCMMVQATAIDLDAGAATITVHDTLRDERKTASVRLGDAVTAGRITVKVVGFETPPGDGGPAVAVTVTGDTPEP
jgi:hypothetical protein